MSEPSGRPSTGPKAIPPFQAFLEANRATVYRFLLAAVGPADADDCFQETFLSALRAYPRLRDATNLRGWALAIAARKAIDAGRSRTRAATPRGSPEEVDGSAGHRTSAPSAEDDALLADEERATWAALSRLPPRQRAAVALRVVLDRPYAEVAAAMGSSEETARGNVYQGLKRLREGWSDADDR